VAAAVWQWFAQLWQQVQPGAVVPINSRVLLLDDFSTWAPPADKQLLWTQLRLLLLESIYAIRSSCSNSRQVSSSTTGDGANDGIGSSSNAAAAMQQQQQSSSNGDDQGTASSSRGSLSFTAKAVACRFRAELLKQLLREWDRVEVDIRIGCGIPMSWLGGRCPSMELDEFKSKWAGLYRVVREGAERHMGVRVSTAGL
jgi:hypothetical protein